MLGRQPKDFDIGTDAHPYQIKRLFRNCWIIGRRFRLAHAKFGIKTIEVATFRKLVPDPGLTPSRRSPAVPRRSSWRRPDRPAVRRWSIATTRSARRKRTHFLMDFTSTRSSTTSRRSPLVDYVGGLSDLERRTIRSIPAIRRSVRRRSRPHAAGGGVRRAPELRPRRAGIDARRSRCTATSF